MSSAETNAGYESLATAASSVIDAINAGAKGLGIAMSDYHAGSIGYIGGDGSAFCGGH